MEQIKKGGKKVSDGWEKKKKTSALLPRTYKKQCPIAEEKKVTEKSVPDTRPHD